MPILWLEKTVRIIGIFWIGKNGNADGRFGTFFGESKSAVKIAHFGSVCPISHGGKGMHPDHRWGQKNCPGV
jgi:hypothetical protein